jgi:hypothetical protein
VWPCDCYEKGGRKEPDLMWDLDLYARLDVAHAWAVIGPVNWYGDEQPQADVRPARLHERRQPIAHKGPELAMKLGEGDELDGEGRPKILRWRA